MKKSSRTPLEHVQKLIKKLSTEERRTIIPFLATFPDSGIQSYNLKDEVETLKKFGKRLIGPDDDPDYYLVNLVFIKNLVSAQIIDTEVLRTIFFPDNFIKAFPKSQRSIQRVAESFRSNLFTPEQKKALRESRRVQGIEETDDQFEEAITKTCESMAEEWMSQKAKRIAEQISLHLPGMVGDMLTSAIKGQTFYDSQRVVKELGGTGKELSISKFKKMITNQAWNEIKPHLGTIQGGARNVKHVWTNDERQCLTENYERLKPIWVEAKRVARASQNAKELSRRNRWAEAVSATYPELESDLIARLAPDSSDAKPADIALTQAARICIPEVTFTTRKLRDEIKAWKAKSLT